MLGIDVYSLNAKFYVKSENFEHKDFEVVRIGERYIRFRHAIALEDLPKLKKIVISVLSNKGWNHYTMLNFEAKNQRDLIRGEAHEFVFSLDENKLDSFKRDLGLAGAKRRLTSFRESNDVL